MLPTSHRVSSLSGRWARSSLRGLAIHTRVGTFIAGDTSSPLVTDSILQKACENRSFLPIASGAYSVDPRGLCLAWNICNNILSWRRLTLDATVCVAALRGRLVCTGESRLPGGG